MSSRASIISVTKAKRVLGEALSKEAEGDPLTIDFAKPLPLHGCGFLVFIYIVGCYTII